MRWLSDPSGTDLTLGFTPSSPFFFFPLWADSSFFFSFSLSSSSKPMRHPFVFSKLVQVTFYITPFSLKISHRKYPIKNVPKNFPPKISYPDHPSQYKFDWWHFLQKCFLQVGELHFAIWELHFAIWRNTFNNFEKYLLQVGDK